MAHILMSCTINIVHGVHAVNEIAITDWWPIGGWWCFVSGLAEVLSYCFDVVAFLWLDHSSGELIVLDSLVGICFVVVYLLVILARQLAGGCVCE